MAFALSNVVNKYKLKLQEESARSGKSFGPNVPTIFIPEGTHKVRFLADKDDNIVESKFVHKLPIVRVSKNEDGTEEKYVGNSWKICQKYNCPLCEVVNDPAYDSVREFSDSAARLTKVLVQVLETNRPDDKRGWVPGGFVIGLIKGKKFYESLTAHYNALFENGDEFAQKYFDLNCQSQGCTTLTVVRGAQGSVTMNLTLKPAPVVNVPDWYSEITLKQPLVNFDEEYTDEMYQQFIKETREGYELLLQESNKPENQTSQIVNQVLEASYKVESPVQVNQHAPVAQSVQTIVQPAANPAPIIEQPKVVVAEVVEPTLPDCFGNVDITSATCKGCTNLINCIGKHGGI